ncbi:MAG TPA: aminotransferase class V-fold PLP-dependent enzyme [Polyangia bacterium]
MATLTGVRGVELLERLRGELVGIDVEVPLLGGGARRYVNLDNAASTPTFRPVLAKVDEFLRLYANVHRGSGFKSQLASWVYDEARRRVARFVGTNLTDKTVIFTKNTTEAINKLARIFPFGPGAVVLTSMMEHHSNELPWRRHADVVHVGLKPDGSLDLEDYARKLAELRGRVELVAITGASNVSGWVNPIHDLARLAHAAGAKIMIDAAQLAPHRPIDMRPADDPAHLDFLAFSAHKMYAPFGVGVLVGDRAALKDAEPDMVGGGMVDIVTIETAYFSDLPEREEAGTPNIVGVVALAAVIGLLEQVGWDAIQAHEQRLVRYALERLARIPGLTVYGRPSEYGVGDRLGVLSFNLEGLHHALVAAVLSYEGGIGVRSGCFCAHPYMLCLLHVGEREAVQVQREILHRDRSHVPGAVRASVGIYNDESDIDALCDCVATIRAGRQRGEYALCRETGTYAPVGQAPFAFEQHFGLDVRVG